MNEIFMLPIESLQHHPDNPRSDLGDLKELTDSIRAQGILQNLTVIPIIREITDEEYEKYAELYRSCPTEEVRDILNRRKIKENDRYWVVIGNRRLEASKAAGLRFLPCQIADMTEKETMRTMMSENMQRQDLTVLDQIQGIGKMQQLGMTLPEIAEGTGLSESTVRRRASIGTLPKKELALACDKGATLLDLLEVTKLEDPEDQAKVLETFGTNNFQYTIQQAIRQANRKKWRERILPKIKEAYPKLRDIPNNERYSGRWKEIARWNDTDQTDEPVPQPQEGRKYGYCDYVSFITLEYEDPAWVESKANEKEYSAWMEERKATAKALNREAFELRNAFIRRFTLKSGKEKLAFEALLIAEMMKWKGFTSGVGYYKGSWDSMLLRKILAIPYESERDREESIEHELARRGVRREAFFLAWAISGGIVSGVRDEDGWVNDYNGQWKPNEDLEAAYRILTALGYEMSDFEKSLQDKSHKFFKEKKP